MIGMIVTGHGKFAPGILDTIEMLSGQPEGCEVVEFLPTDSVEEMTVKMAAAWDRLDQVCGGVVVFADIMGGTPFNTALRLKMLRRGDSELVSGVNVPMLLAAALSNTDAGSAAELAAEAIEAAQTQPFLFVPPELGDEDEVDED